MKTFRLLRVAYIPDGTFGVLFDEETPFCLTLEREWKDNKRNVSCIPKDNYLCESIWSNKFGSTYEVKEVKGRSHILFHKGNIEDDSHGCIILGEQFGVLGEKNAILCSGDAFAEFKMRLNEEHFFKLEVKDA